MPERPDETGDDVQALAPLLVFALALPSPAQVSDEKDRVRRETLDHARVLANPHSAGVPIVLASILPDSASPGVEAWTVFREDGKGDRVVVYTESSVFICASRHMPVQVNPYICRLKLASIIVHEAWHFKNGPDESGAYEAQRNSWSRGAPVLPQDRRRCPPCPRPCEGADQAGGRRGPKKS